MISYHTHTCISDLFYSSEINNCIVQILLGVTYFMKETQSTGISATLTFNGSLRLAAGVFPRNCLTLASGTLMASKNSFTTMFPNGVCSITPYRRARSE